VNRVSPSAARRIAWTLWAFQVAVLVLQGTLTVIAPVTASDSSWGTTGRVSDVAFQLITFAFPMVAILIVHRQPYNRIGWLLLAVIGFVGALLNLLDCYSVYALVIDPGSLPGGAVTSALNESSWVWTIGTIGIFLVLLFPDGRLPSPRWRWLPWVAGVALIVVPALDTLSTAKLTESPVPDLTNPLFVGSLSPPVLVAADFLLALIPISIVAAAVALVMRFRRSHGTERLQLKWLAGAGAIIAICYFAAMAGTIFVPAASEDSPPMGLRLLEDLATASFGLIPVAIGIAILRHRLYDIDVVIKRTLVYGSLTLSLASIYLGVVLTLQSLTDPVTGDSDLAVATSTLVVAALFRPLRRRIQTGVDRRFFRRAYDATLTLESFTDRLRQEVSLDAVSADLRDVVDETMQPAHLSLWLRRADST
jgi:hypothetical protein